MQFKDFLIIYEILTHPQPTRIASNVIHFDSAIFIPLKLDYSIEKLNVFFFSVFPS